MKLKILNQRKIVHKNGQLVVFEKSKKINFKIKRVFVIKSNRLQIRGKHAHKKCTQLLNCPTGSVEIYYENKTGVKSKLILSRPDQFLIIPPLTWCVQKYLKNNSILIGICDQKYKESDYIRSYKNYLNSI
tara:strand:+ start:467 stop:859 length:393 start_codon:yes stop_codon:yes gene_type:complete